MSGGAVVTLSDVSEFGGGTWADDGTIVFSPNFIGPLMRVSSDGGVAEALTTSGAGELMQRWPQVLPGGRAVLYTSSPSPTSVANASLVVQSLVDGTTTIVKRGATYGRYVPLSPGPPSRDGGHLMFVQGGTLFAAPFDMGRLELVDPAVPLIEGITADMSGGGGGVGGAQVALSAPGTLVYLPGAIERPVSAPVVLTDHLDRTTSVHVALTDWSHPKFSPDGRRLTIDITDEAGNTDLWVYDVSRGDLARATTHPGSDVEPTWTPDGQRLVFQSTRENATTNLYWQRADGAGGVQRLTRSAHQQFGGSSWHPAGRILAFTEVGPQTGADLMILRMEGDEDRGGRRRSQRLSCARRPTSASRCSRPMGDGSPTSPTTRGGSRSTSSRFQAPAAGRKSRPRGPITLRRCRGRAPAVNCCSGLPTSASWSRRIEWTPTGSMPSHRGRGRGRRSWRCHEAAPSICTPTARAW